MRPASSCVCLCALLTTVALSQTVSTGFVSGTISDNNGKPIQAVSVVASPAEANGGMSSTSVTNGAGQFNLSLAAGTYLLCAQLPGSAYLDPCIWSTGAKVIVSSGQTSTPVALTLTKGSLIRVHLNDPSQVMRTTLPLLVGVTDASSHFHPLRLIATDPSGRIFEIAVPSNASYRLEMSGSGIDFSDANAVSLGAVPTSVPVQAAAPEAQTTLTFTVAAKP